MSPAARPAAADVVSALAAVYADTAEAALLANSLFTIQGSSPDAPAESAEVSLADALDGGDDAPPPPSEVEHDDAYGLEGPAGREPGWPQPGPTSLASVRWAPQPWTRRLPSPRRPSQQPRGPGNGFASRRLGLPHQRRQRARRPRVFSPHPRPLHARSRPRCRTPARRCFRACRHSMRRLRPGARAPLPPSAVRPALLPRSTVQRAAWAFSTRSRLNRHSPTCR